MGGLFAPLFAWFFELVGSEAKAEIQRKKARKRKAKKATAKKKKQAETEHQAAIKCQEDWRKTLADRRERATTDSAERAKHRRVDVGPPVELDDNPYEEDE